VATWSEVCVTYQNGVFRIQKIVEGRHLRRHNPFARLSIGLLDPGLALVHSIKVERVEDFWPCVSQLLRKARWDFGGKSRLTLTTHGPRLDLCGRGAVWVSGDAGHMSNKLHVA
jgi:hypothetical protein